MILLEIVFFICLFNLQYCQKTQKMDIFDFNYFSPEPIGEEKKGIRPIKFYVIWTEMYVQFIDDIVCS